MKLSDLKQGSYSVEDTGDAPLKLSSLHPSQYKVEESASPVGSAVRQFVQGASSGFSDELAGLAEGAGRAVGLKGVGGPVKDISRDDNGPTLDMDQLKAAYKLGRDHERAALAKDSRDNPATSAMANFAGMVASPANKLNPAAAGAAMGLGNSDAEDLGGMAKDTATGGVLGYGAGKVAEKAAPLLEGAVNKVASGSKELAKKFAARAIGAERGSIRKLGSEKVMDAAGQLLDNGGISLGSSTEDMIAKNDALKQSGGEAMNRVYKVIDDANASKFNPLDVAVDVENKIGKFWRSPLNKAETGQFENTMESILQRGDKPISLQEAQVLKEEIGKAANFKKAAHLDVTPKEQMARDTYGIINEHIDNAVNDASKVVKDAGLGDELAKGKELYGNSKTADKLLTTKQAKEQGNKLFGLTDAIAGAGALGYGEASGDWKGAGAIVLAKKGLEKYGAKAAALALNNISKTLSTTPELANLAKSHPQAFNAIVEKIGQRFSESLPKAASAPESKPVPKGGPSKWASDGLNALMDHAGDQAPESLKQIDPSQVDDKSLQNLLISASDLKPGSPAMDKVLAKVKARLDQ